jgi:CRISPR-associated protein (TIGR02584 family)
MAHKRILLAVTGLSPQVVTETLFALARKRSHAWLADEVHLITTARGADNARLRLLGPNTRWLARLCEDWRLPLPRLDDSTIHVIPGRDGSSLLDIRDDTENAAAADYIAEVVRTLTQDEHTEVCASIAGGRKTMGFLLGEAMSLFGRAQDMLCHVLVSAPFEAHPEFFYPTPHSHVITALDRTAEALDCRDAQVWLGDIPFVRLRQWLPAEVLQQRRRFSDVVAAATASLAQRQPPTLQVGRDDAHWNGQALGLAPRPLALLVLLAAHTVAGSGLRSPLRGVGDDAEWRAEALQAVEHAAPRAVAQHPALRRWLMQPHTDLAAAFDQALSRLRRALRLVGHGIDWIDERAPGAVAQRRSYRLALPREHIHWLDAPVAAEPT